MFVCLCICLTWSWGAGWAESGFNYLIAICVWAVRRCLVTSAWDSNWRANLKLTRCCWEKRLWQLLQLLGMHLPMHLVLRGGVRMEEVLCGVVWLKDCLMVSLRSHSSFHSLGRITLGTLPVSTGLLRPSSWVSAVEEKCGCFFWLLLFFFKWYCPTRPQIAGQCWEQEIGAGKSKLSGRGTAGHL